MERITYRITLDTHKNGIQRTLQGFETADKMARRIAVNLMSGGDTYEIPSDHVVAMVYVTTPNAEEPSINECTVEGNTIVYDVLPIVEEGITEMQIKLIKTSATGAKKVLTAPKFAVEVAKSGADDEDAEQSVTFTALEDAIAKANSVYNTRIVHVWIEPDCTFKVEYADGTIYENVYFRDVLYNGNAILSESWARGGTGTREGEDTDNSKYYSNLSKSSAKSIGRTAEEIRELAEEAKLYSAFTAFDVDFETGELMYLSRNYGFDIDENTGELMVDGGDDYTPEDLIGSEVDKYAAEFDRKISVERARIDAFTSLAEGSTTGDAELIDARIDKEGIVHENVGDHIREISEKINNEILGIVYMPSNPHLIDWNSIHLNTYLNVNGSTQENDAHWASDFIEVEPNTQYIFGNTVEFYKTVFANCNFFDGNKKFISNVFNDSTFTTPDNCKFVRIGRKYENAYGVGSDAGITEDNYLTADYIINKTQIQKGTVPKPVEDTKLHEKVKLKIANITDEVLGYIKFDTNPLYGKKVYCIGDSHIEQGNIINALRKNTGMIVTNYGDGGTRLADYNGTFPDAICHRIDALPDELPDLILVEGGCNDCGATTGTPLGTVGESTDYTTLAGAVYYIIQKLIQKYGDVPIVFGTMPYRWFDGQKYRDYSTIVKEECEFLGVPCLDAWKECGMNEFNRELYNLNNDGIHLNQEGANKYARAWLREIEKVIY